MEKLPLSLVIVTKNEENSIVRCLRSVPFASEVLVVDSFSTDQTKTLAEQNGARVLQRDWPGFGPQKKWAVEQAQNDWVLSLDADEALSPELATEIQQKWSALNPQAAYAIPRRSFHLGRWILHGGWTPDRQVRLFHRRHSQWTDQKIHESVKAPQTDQFSQPILHWVFDDLSDQVITNDRYSSLQAQERIDRGETFSLLGLIFRPWGKFMETYFLKLGFLDGLPGFLISVSAAYSMFLRYAKMWEIERKKS